MITRIIPSSGEKLPVIGLGTWQTFDVPVNAPTADLTNVIELLHGYGGKVIDSSPMYGRSEKVVGNLTSKLDCKNEFFYATKVWITGLQNGIAQMEQSMALMQRTTMDLMQIHNLTDWKTHLPVLRKWKEAGKIRYIGITHYTDSSHEELERIMKTEKIDFVQFNYSISSRNAEKRLLPAAVDLGVATLINRPLGEGNLFSKVKGKSLPSWAVDLGIQNWAAFFLTYLIAHPAVTCVIPGTSKPQHAKENFSASSHIPDEKTRKMMVDFLGGL